MAVLRAAMPAALVAVIAPILVIRSESSAVAANKLNVFEVLIWCGSGVSSTFTNSSPVEIIAIFGNFLTSPCHSIF